MIERVVRNDEVVGLIPIRSTILKTRRPQRGGRKVVEATAAGTERR